MGTCAVVRRPRLDGARVHGGRALRSAAVRLHRGQQRRHHQPGPEDRASWSAATPWKQQVALMIGVLTTRRRDRRAPSAPEPNNFTQMQARADRGPAAPGREPGPCPGPIGRGLPGRARGADVEGAVPDGTYLVDPTGARPLPGAWRASVRTSRLAPQATLMSLVIEGILTRQLPWGSCCIGVFISILMEIGRCARAWPSPSASTCLWRAPTPVFAGGLARSADRLAARLRTPSPTPVPASSTAPG